MDIAKLIKEKEKTKSDFDKLKFKLIDLKYDIDVFCETKIGYVVEHFDEIFYITKYSNGIFLGLKVTKEDSRINKNKNTKEIIFPDKCKFLGKGEIIGNKVNYKKNI